MDNECPCYEQHRKGPLADYYRLSNCNAIELETYIYNDGKSPSFSAFTKYLLKEPGYVSPERKKEKCYTFMLQPHFPLGECGLSVYICTKKSNQRLTHTAARHRNFR